MRNVFSFLKTCCRRSDAAEEVKEMTSMTPINKFRTSRLSGMHRRQSFHDGSAPGSWTQYGNLAGRGDGSLEWECPWCGYALWFTRWDSMTAEDVVRSHLLSRHSQRFVDNAVQALLSLRGNQ